MRERQGLGVKSDEAETKTKDATTSADVRDGGTVCGYAATFDDEPDSYGDVIIRGAFAETLGRWAELEAEGKHIPLLYGHNMQDPACNIGYVTLAREDERGLYVEAKFDPDSETAQYVRKLVKEGRLYQFSFSYHINKASDGTREGKYVYELHKLDLLEVSLVQVPANRHAVVTEVKAAAAGQKSGRRNSKADEDELRGILGKLDEARAAIVALLGDETDESDGGKADDTASTKDDDASDTGEKSTEGDEGKVMPEGHEVDESARVEAYRAALLAGLSNR